MLNTRLEIESLNWGENLIKRRLSLVYIGVCVFFQPTSTHLLLPSTKGFESIEEGGCPRMFCKSFYVWRQNLTKNTFNAFIYSPAVVSINTNYAKLSSFLINFCIQMPYTGKNIKLFSPCIYLYWF